MTTAGNPNLLSDIECEFSKQPRDVDARLTGVALLRDLLNTYCDILRMKNLLPVEKIAEYRNRAMEGEKVIFYRGAPIYWVETLPDGAWVKFTFQ